MRMYCTGKSRRPSNLFKNAGHTRLSMRNYCIHVDIVILEAYLFVGVLSGNVFIIVARLWGGLLVLAVRSMLLLILSCVGRRGSRNGGKHEKKRNTARWRGTLETPLLFSHFCGVGALRCYH